MVVGSRSGPLSMDALPVVQPKRYVPSEWDVKSDAEKEKGKGEKKNWILRRLHNSEGSYGVHCSMLLGEMSLGFGRCG